MKLATNERILKEWTYAKKKSGLKKTRSVLTVTNKRIVCDEFGAKKIERQEIPLDSVKSLSFKKESGTGVLMIVFGVLTLCIFVGIILLIAGILKMIKGSFSFTITTYGEEGTPLEMGTATMTQRKGLFARIFNGLVGGGKKMRVKIDKEAAEEIIETLGAIIIENKTV